MPEQPTTEERLDLSSLIDEAATAAEESGDQQVEEKPVPDAPDVAQLREVLGDDFKDVTDDELLAEFQQAAQSGESDTTAWDRSWSFVDSEGQPVTNLAELTPDQMLAMSVRYKAAGAEQTRTWDEVVRLAQRAHGTDDSLRDLQEEYARAVQAQTELQQTVEQFKEQEKFWLWVMQDPTGERFLQAQEKFRGDDAPEPAAQPGSFTPEQEQRGEAVFQQHYRPQLLQLAQSYSEDGNEPSVAAAMDLAGKLELAFRTLVAQEGAMIASNPQYGQMRLTRFIESEIPQALQQIGLKPVGQKESDVSALRARLQQVQAELAKRKLDRAPDLGRGSAPPAGTPGPDLSSVKSFRDIQKMLDDPEQTFGL